MIDAMVNDTSAHLDIIENERASVESLIAEGQSDETISLKVQGLAKAIKDYKEAAVHVKKHCLKPKKAGKEQAETWAVEPASKVRSAFHWASGLALHSVETLEQALNQNHVLGGNVKFFGDWGISSWQPISGATNLDVWSGDELGPTSLPGMLRSKPCALEGEKS